MEDRILNAYRRGKSDAAYKKTGKNLYSTKEEISAYNEGSKYVLYAMLFRNTEEKSEKEIIELCQR
jgi:hypothetical protein